MSHAVRLTIDPQNSTTEVNSGVESAREAAVDPVGLFTCNRAVFPNRRAAARYRALASIIPGRERFWNLSF